MSDKKIVFGPEDLRDIVFGDDIGVSGEYPFTRGIHSEMYSKRLWTMRLFSGFGSAENTNQRYKDLLEAGQNGLSVAFDLPTLLGFDSDNPQYKTKTGKGGVAIDSLADMEILFKDIPLDKITTSMTINAPAAVLLAMYIALAQKRGIPQEELAGTIQNDILKEYIAQNEWIFPPGPSMKLIVDTIEYCTKHLPKWNTISISGYHIREAGATVDQELGFTLANGIAYVQAARGRGLAVDDFAPRLSFFFDLHNNFLEEIAKLRAARKLWAKIMKERFGARNPRSWMLRAHAQTAGCTLTREQPLNNIVRVTIQALAGILGGVQSLHTDSYDEEISLPSEEAVTVALRTQQIIAYETGVTQIVDPLAGSYALEYLTKRIGEEAWGHIMKIDSMGGMLKAIEQWYPQKEIFKNAQKIREAQEQGKEVIVGVNKLCDTSEEREAVFRVNPDTAKKQLMRLKQVKKDRDNVEVVLRLAALQAAAEGGENVMPYLISACGAYATLGEICDVLREVFGQYQGTFVV